MKAVVDVFNFDGTLVSHYEFVTNQEAADFMVPYVREHRKFDINYQPIGLDNLDECAILKE